MYQLEPKKKKVVQKHDKEEIEYQNMHKLQQVLVDLIRKLEILKLIAQDVSHKATLSRIGIFSNIEVNNYKPTQNVPLPDEREGYEKKFKQLRRCAYIMFDEVMEIKKYIRNLLDTVRITKKSTKDEKVDDDVFIIKKEKPKQLQIQPCITQVINLIEDDDVAILPVVEIAKPIEERFKLGPSDKLNVCCFCNIKASEPQIPFEVELCYAYSAQFKVDFVIVSQKIIQEALKNLSILKGDHCLSYELIYYLERFPNQRQAILKLLNVKLSQLQLGIDQKLLFDNQIIYFPMFESSLELINDRSLFMIVFRKFLIDIKAVNIDHQGGNFYYFMKLLLFKVTYGQFINAYNEDLDKCRMLSDFMEIILELNPLNITIGVNQMIFPEQQKNSEILLCYYNRNLNSQEQTLIKDNLQSNEGCHINSHLKKIPRLIIVFSRKKLFIPAAVGKAKHWEIPVDHLNKLEAKYFYQFLIQYMDIVIQCNIKDKKQKFFTLLFFGLRDMLSQPVISQIEEQYKKFVEYKGFLSMIEVGFVSKPKTKLKSQNKQIARLLGHFEQ
ncbi:hypothetical protein pb186bvf_015107 [Paramecium bursaria]